MSGRGSRGYTLLVMMMLVAAATLFMLALMELGGSERLAEGSTRNQYQARSIAEAGLARTTGYLNQLVAQDGDFDRALDPNLDDGCLLPTALTNTADDHLPPFPDGVIVDAGAGQSFMEVAQGGGAYLVRIDDDEDDQGAMGTAFTKNDHLGPGNCVEGVAIAEDRVRDTNQTVIVTVVGIYPGTDLSHPLATQTLRVTLGPPPGPGLIAAGTVTLGGTAQVSGAYDNVAVVDTVTGAVGNASIFSAPSSVIKATGTCTAGGLPAPTCDPNWVLPPAPYVDPWDVQNAPLAAVGGSGEAFYYVRDDPAELIARTFQWNYATCPNPRAFSRICYPDFASGANNDVLLQVDGGATRCATCWTPIYSGPTDGGLIGDPRFPFPPPPLGLSLFSVVAAPDRACVSDPDPGTLPSPRWPNTVWPGATFTATTDSPPPGIWFLEGSLVVNGPWGGCSATSFDVLGDIQVAGTASLAPGAPRSYTLLAGKDLSVGATGAIADCGFPAATLVHEQVSMSGGDQINGELVVANRATCDPLVSVGGGGSLYGSGTMTLVNNHPGPIPLGPAIQALSWSESSL